MLRRIIFLNKNAIKPVLGIFKVNIGKIYVGWERVWEFHDFFWDFIWPMSSHTDPQCLQKTNECFKEENRAILALNSIK